MAEDTGAGGWGGRAPSSSAVLEAWFKCTTLGVALLDHQLRYVRINGTLAAINQRPAAEHVGQDVPTMAPLVADFVLPWLHEALRTGQPLLGRPVAGPGLRSSVLDIIPVDDGVLVVLVDTTALQHAERIQQARLRLSELVSEVSAGFIGLPATDLARGIDAGLRIAGEALSCDRCYVSLFSEDQEQLKITHLWVRDPSQLLPHDSAPVHLFQGLVSRIRAGHTFLFDSIATADLGGPEQALPYIANNVQALVTMPLRVGRDILGLVGFTDTRSPRQWSTEVLTSMRLIVEIFASALDRQRQDDRLRAQQEFDALVARLSREFTTAPSAALDQVVLQALATVGQGLGFDRALLFHRDRTNVWTSLWHEWLAPGMPSLGPDFTPVRLVDLKNLPPAYHQGEGVVIDADRLPAAATVCRSFLEDGVVVAWVVAMRNGGQTLGTLALQSRTRRVVPQEFSGQLTLLGELFASVIARTKAEQARELAYKELEALKGSIERERDYLREELRSEHQVGAILGHSPALRVTLDAVAAVAITQASVLIRGESGVGKELIACAIHDQSTRRDGPLVKVNCAAVPRELFESEFFGHVRGSFTGAHKDRAGRFELADRGTLFLDEVGDIPLDLQAKLLRVLQDGEYERVGEERTRKANVRLIAATNRDLQQDLAAGRFRSDLYYRLSTFPIEVPPLRERREDIVVLAHHFLALYARNAGKRGLVIEPEQERQLCAYSWPGNVRELQHVIERAVILASESHLELALPKLSTPAHTWAQGDRSAAPAHPRRTSAPPLPMAELKRLERDNLLAALEQTHWRIAGVGGAAELLGLKPSTLRDRMRALGIDRRR